MPDVVELRDIRKQFATGMALDGVSLRIEGGSVLGLLGENGAGKSTLMNILYGMVRTDGGKIIVDGEEVWFGSPGDAIERGIGMVHQHFMLVPAMSVVDNVLLGDRREGRVVDRTGASERLAGLSRRLDLEVDPSAIVGKLSVGEQQRVEILKALWRDVKVLILDEPTAVLTPGETGQLLEAMKRLRDEGKAIVFISHKIGEVKSVCDRIIVLRRGKMQWEGAAEGIDERELARRMVGEEALGNEREARPNGHRGDAILRLVGARTEGIEAVSLDVSAEIFGVAGVDGNGQQELAEMLMGLRGLTGGRIQVAGVDVSRSGAAKRARLGMAHVPADRKQEGLALAMNASQNIAIRHHRERGFSRFGWMAWRQIESAAKEACAAYGLRGDVRAPVGTLSGGNQQKVVLARELGISRPRVLIAHNPTRGLDVGASRFVHEELLRLREAGCAVVLISTELEELVRVCDRIGVLYRGRLTVSEFPRAGIEQIGRLMAGGVERGE